MGLSINQNIMAMNSYRNLSATQTGLSKSLEKLSSGYRINRAADDAAGLAISEGLRTQVRGNTQAVRNAQDGISVVQTAEGALNEVHDILQRQRELAVQAANDSNNADARNNIDAEFKQLTDELKRIADSTNFNGTKLLDGSAGDNHDGKLNFQVGADGDAASRIVVDLSSANVKSVAETVAGGATLTEDKKQTYEIDLAGITGGSIDLQIGGKSFTQAFSTDANTTATQLKTQLEATTAAGIGNDYDVTIAGAKITVTKKVAGADSNAASLSGGTGLGANALTTTQKGGLEGELSYDSTTGYNVSSHAEAQRTINLIDGQIKSISTARANLGAVQNRFEHTINNLNVAVENLSASESRIRDTDMASEMMKFTRNQILSQAGTSMLAQANQVPQGVLSLLR